MALGVLGNLASYAAGNAITEHAITLSGVQGSIAGVSQTVCSWIFMELRAADLKT